MTNRMSEKYKIPADLRTISSVQPTFLTLHPLICYTMQFFKSTILFALAFATFAVAAPADEGTLQARKECKPLLQSCGVDSECCGDLCVAGVTLHLSWCGRLLVVDHECVSFCFSFRGYYNWDTW
ncbi:hypothetical protein PILCRDRAFT_330286 [Piloderma croceum F 1598]|uniref:Uncharacterized protein n=1 Tax=Piloderma croceum (strain F 1598) TaxID=765440 RepID=A0A0C3G5R0_PILCF|nr:hypothetical protein PILCRDRAFT_330286 [Piloderma croceum F 1598]